MRVPSMSPIGTAAPVPYRWLVRGDWNGFFGLVVDNVSVLAFLATVLTGVFRFPPDVVLGRMFPGTALGVLAGDVLYTGLAFRLARRTGRADVTAMPLGLDTPSTIGMALLVLGPAFLRFQQAGMDVHAAAIAAWHLGMAATVIMGLLKLVLSFAGSAVQRLVPRAALLGSIAGIALALIGFFPLVEVLRFPVAGMVSLGIVLYSLVARGPLPRNLPGVLVAFVVGTALHYALGPLGMSGGAFEAPHVPQLRLALPHVDPAFVDGFRLATDYLPLILPFALLTVVGGINVTESARVAGDDYNTREVLWVDAAATLLAGALGGVAQTTPYIGQPSYKHMGARAGYTLLVGAFIGLGGILGFLGDLVELLPLAVLAPILVFVALDITAQAFEASPRRHAAAVALAFFPAIARMVAIKLGDPTVVPPARFAELLSAPGHALPEMRILVALGNGFILTSMLWAGFLAEVVDRKPRRAAAHLGVGAVLAFFGIIHSVHPDGGAYLPWQLRGIEHSVALQLSFGYAVLSLVMALLSLQRWAPSVGVDE
jgi:AGZA family xanthine/uracil permease-like MFS transporter